MKIKTFIYLWLIKIGLVKPTYYINGSQTLPPPLNSDEEAILISRDDKKAKDILIVHNLRLVVYIARKFEAPNANIEDLISIGTIGLIKAVNTFKVDKNIKLATYASRCIENEILMHLRSNKKYKEAQNIIKSIMSNQLKENISLLKMLPSDIRNSYWNKISFPNMPVFINPREYEQNSEFTEWICNYMIRNKNFSEKLDSVTMLCYYHHRE